MLAVALALALQPMRPAAAAEGVPSPMAETVSCASGDGKWLLVARGPTLSLFDASGVLHRSWPVTDRAGRLGQVLALADHASRRSFIVALRDLNEVWELSYDPQAEPLFEGLVHDYRMGEGLASPGYLALRRTLLAAPVLGMVVDGRKPWVLVHQAGGTAVLHLDVRRLIPQVPASAAQGLPAPAHREPPLRFSPVGTAPGGAHQGCGCPACRFRSVRRLPAHAAHAKSTPA